MLETAQHRSSTGLPSGSESKQRCVKRQVDGGMEQGQGHASLRRLCRCVAGRCNDGSECMEKWRGGRDENFQCPSKKPLPLLLHSLTVRLRLLVSDHHFSTQRPCPGLWALSPWLCRECGVFRAVEEGREWANGRWPLREPGKWNGGVGEMAGIPPPPGGPNAIHSLPFCFQARDLVLSLKWKRWPSTPLSRALLFSVALVPE